MCAKFLKTISVIFLILLSVLEVHGVIRTYKEGKYWTSSFYTVSVYLLLNVTKNIINITDEDEPKNKRTD